MLLCSLGKDTLLKKLESGGIGNSGVKKKTDRRPRNGRTPKAQNLAAIKGIASDITRRKSAEEELRKTEEEYQLVLRTIREILYIVDGDPMQGTVRMVSDSVRNLLGCEPNDFQKDPALWFSLLHPDDVPEVMQVTQDAITRRTPGVRTYRLRNKQSGEYRWLEDCFTPVFDNSGQILGIYGVARDITDRKQMETQLQESEERYHTLFEQSRDAIVITAPNGLVVDANRSALDLFGVGKERLGKLLRDVFQQPFFDERNLSQVLEKEGFFKDHEVKLGKQDGTPIDCLISSAVRRGGDGRMLEFHTTIHDITKQKRAAQGLRKLSGRLLRVRDEEQRRVAQELHEGAGQTLTALVMNLVLARKSAERSNRRVRDLLTTTLELAEQSLREIRTVSYLLHPPLLDEGGLQTALQWLADGFAKRSGIRVDLDLAPTVDRLPREWEIGLFRVVQECLANIHRHSGSSTAKIRLAQQGQQILLEVSDQGRGIVPGAGKETGSVAPPGVGIAAMRERMVHLGGDLQIKSSSKGTTIRAVLALQASTAAASPRR